MKNTFTETDYKNYLEFAQKDDTIFETEDLKQYTFISYAYYCFKHNIEVIPATGDPYWPEEALTLFEEMIKEYEWEQEETARLGMIESNKHDYEGI